MVVRRFGQVGEPISPSLQLLQAGSVEPLAATETGLGDAIRALDYQWRGTLSYIASGNGDESGTLTGRIEHLTLGTYSVSALVDLSGVGSAAFDDDDNYLGRTVYYGFSAGNGLADDGHFVTSAAPVPLPTAGWLLVSALAGVGALGRRR